MFGGGNFKIGQQSGSGTIEITVIIQVYTKKEGEIQGAKRYETRTVWRGKRTHTFIVSEKAQERVAMTERLEFLKESPVL